MIQHLSQRFRRGIDNLQKLQHNICKMLSFFAVEEQFLNIFRINP